MRKLALTMIALALGVLALTPTVAFAHHEDGHEQGPPDRQEAPQDDAETTEDNDGDGEPNCPDPEGDEDNQHPSGQDKHCEPGGSGNQGDAQSDPDDDGRGPDRSNGGADQPGGDGGEDQLDQDGNNGCGNDDDFEDDNEGLCGGPEGEQPEGGEQPEEFEQSEVEEGAEVAGVTIDRDEQPEQEAVADVGAEAPGEAAVLGIRFERAPSDQPAPGGEVDAADSEEIAAPGTLARSGIPAGLLGLAGLGLVAAGFGLRRRA